MQDARVRPQLRNNAGSNSNAASLEVLVIDDDTLCRMHLREALACEDIRISEAADGETGINALTKTLFDIVLLDVRMPGMDGFKACRLIRDGDLNANTPIIMLTGSDDLESIQASLAAGANDFITKPFRTTLLRQRIHHIVQAHRNHQALEQKRSEQQALLSALPDSILRFDAANRLTDTKLSNDLPLPLLDKLSIGAKLEAIYAAPIEAVNERMIRVEHAGIDMFFELRFATSAGNERLCIVRDITEQETQKQQIETLSLTDPITGLPNQAHLIQRLQKFSNEHPGLELALIRLCLDNLDSLEDSVGRRVTNDARSHIAQLLRHLMKRVDSELAKRNTTAGLFLASTGKGEFHILAPLPSQMDLTERLRHLIVSAFAQTVELANYSLSFQPRIGIATCKAGDVAVDKLIQQSALAAKTININQETRRGDYSPELERAANRALTMESALRTAILREELTLVYQPKVCAQSGALHGMEALLRWHSPSLGFVSPGEFIPLAEETGQILALGDYVLRAACRQAVAWRESGFQTVPIAVNVSGHQLNQSQFDQKVHAILAQTGARAHEIELEVTESVFMGNQDMTLAYLQTLRADGLRIALDDFGTGFSSLSQLKQLPVDILKIDRCFVTDIESANGNYAVVDAIIALAKAMQLAIVAEGVETPEQLEYLREGGCHLIQGYLTGRPCQPEEIEPRFQPGPVE
ncbi:putative bifunctional diguanylate cyclase/phosphodiesterase [Marinobacter sp. SS21]|uniref:putative bifunctional diguanylate cyclase/phosphodiesterase n=1 Tax=Marinobacter sp. SS21 TaxID=2979460 RepID=UPI00232DD37A|nr:EAL domain-containing protein [Marinobacter sp. SS21]MDC0662283.1 EAL domain-containing protein [Marinobacter sp. SS21]